jgi:hypothetical protein
MKISDKLLRKYAVGNPIIPPPLEEVIEVKTPLPASEESLDRLLRLRQDSEEFDPLTEKPAVGVEELKEEFESEPPTYEKELMEVLHPEFHAKQDAPTRAPKKKANLSADTLLKMCGKYLDLCSKF